MYIKTCNPHQDGWPAGKVRMDQEGRLAAVATHHPSWLSHSTASVGQGSRHDTVNIKDIMDA